MIKTYLLLILTCIIWGIVYYTDHQQHQDTSVTVKQTLMLPKFDEIQEISIKKNGFDHVVLLIKQEQGFKLKNKHGQIKDVDPFIEKQLKTALQKEIKPIQYLPTSLNQLNRFSLTEAALQIQIKTVGNQKYHLRIGQEIQKKDSFALFLDDQLQPILKDQKAMVIRFNERLRLLFDREDRYWQRLMPQYQEGMSDGFPQYLSYHAQDQHTHWTVIKKDQKWQMKDQALHPLYQNLSDIQLSEEKIQGLLYTMSHIKLDAYIEDLNIQHFEFKPIGYFEYMDQYQQKYKISLMYENHEQGQLKQPLQHRGMFLKIQKLSAQGTEVIQDFGIGHLSASQSSFITIQLESLFDRSILSQNTQLLNMMKWVQDDQEWVLKRIYSNDPILQWEWQNMKKMDQTKLVSVNAFQEYIALFKDEGIGFVFDDQQGENLGYIEVQFGCAPPLLCSQVDQIMIKKIQQKILVKSVNKKKEDPWLNIAKPHYDQIKHYFDHYELK